MKNGEYIDMKLDALENENKQLKARIAELEARNKELEARTTPIEIVEVTDIEELELAILNRWLFGEGVA